MRSEKVMLDLITETARRDPQIRAAYLEGSRANPNVPKDMFQDYDVVYVVKDTRPFIEDRGWIDRFGDRLYMQYPQDGPYCVSQTDRCYGWLMQFADGPRLDLHVCTPDYIHDSMELYKTLVDKDGILPGREMVSDEIYWVKRPSQEEFLCTCNEFWWCLNNVAKGLWRGEMPYVMDMVNLYIRPMLTRLLEWKIGADTGFSVNVGKCAKYMDRYLPEDLYHRYLRTYSPASAQAVWDSVFIMCSLFDEIAMEVSIKLDFPYDSEEAAGSTGYLRSVSAQKRA